MTSSFLIRIGASTAALLRARIVRRAPALLVLVSLPLWGQPPANETGSDNGPGAESEPKTVAELIEDSDRIDGLFTLYRDRKTGDLRMLLDVGQLDRTYLYFMHTVNGVPAAGHFRGAFGGSQARVFRISRFFDRVEFVAENSNFWFDPGKAISRAADANISSAVVADLKIEAENEAEQQLLINVNPLFMTEAFQRIAPLPNPDQPPTQGFRIGSLDAGKTKIREVRNYPRNTEVIVEYVYKNEQAYVSGGSEVTDARAVSIAVQHSLIQAPDDDFVPRFDDPRVGYFTDRVTDLSSTSIAPYRDSIHRWNLVKQDPAAAISEPVEPIVYWIENTTPVELRPVIEAAALRWNEAFESAGFRNAIQVRVQPDDADWDAGDIRYNVIRWTSSPSPQFGGYGPSFADPRTGQILGADIMLEHIVIGGNILDAMVFGEGYDSFSDDAVSDPNHCVAGLLAHREMLFASAALETLGAGSEEQQRLLEEFIHFLTLHEMGHTLGLNHNFRASHMHSLDAIFDPDQTYAVGLHGSVMDYPAVPFALPGESQGQFWTTRPGPYDHWAITFGYSSALDDANAEAERLETILSRSTEPALAFANDADDMRAPGKAIDPRANVNDMTNDPIGFARHQIDVVNAVVGGFEDRLVRDGESYQLLLNAYQVASQQYRDAVRTASRFIGGVYVDRAMASQPGARDPLTPAAVEDQRRAMQLLAEAVFAPDALGALQQSADHLLAQRRGFDHSATTEDPKLHSLVLNIQRDALSHLLHPRVLTRLTDTRVYGNEYAVADMMTDLTDAIFEADLGGDVNTFRQNLQLDYVDRLLRIVKAGNDSGFDNVARAMALDRLRWIEQELAGGRRSNAETRAHRNHVLFRIDRGLDDTDA